MAASMVEKERSRRLSTATLNQVVREAIAFKSSPRTRGGKRGRIYYCTQVSISCPSTCHHSKRFIVIIADKFSFYRQPLGLPLLSSL